MQTSQLKDTEEVFDDYCKSIARYFNFSLRELNRYYLRVSLIKSNAIGLLKLPTKTYWNDEINIFLYGIIHFIMFFRIEPYLVALKMIDEDKYNGNDDNNITKFLRDAPYMEKIINGKKVNNFSRDTKYAVRLLESENDAKKVQI